MTFVLSGEDLLPGFDSGNLHSCYIHPRNKMSNFKQLHEKWSREPDYRKSYDEMRAEFELARALITARTQAGLTQAQLAARMETSQSVVSRLESGQAHPSTKTLERIARATGTRLRIAFEEVSDAV